MSTRGQEWQARRTEIMATCSSLGDAVEKAYLAGLGEGAADWRAEMYQRAQLQYQTEANLKIAIQERDQARADLQTLRAEIGAVERTFSLMLDSVRRLDAEYRLGKDTP